ncbi:MAG: hypothetical protein IH609_08995 [Dehalococcoidia bacterium]|nr:hypothetical protein [Dehalococcoidia bacterium]
MSIFKAFVDAFKKASTAKTPDALEHARSDGVLGPTTGDAAGSFEPLRPAPGVPPGGSAAPGAEDIKTTGDEMRGSSVAEYPGAGGEYKVEGLTVAPIDDGGEVVEIRPPPAGFKVDDLSVVEDPDAGGEVASLKENIDPAFVRRLRFSPDAEPSVQSSDPEEGGEVVARLRSPAAEGGGPAIASSDPEEGGEVMGGGSGLERGIPEGHVPGGGSGLERGIPEGHVPGGELTTVPNASLDLHLAEGVDQMVSAEPGSEPRRGNLLTQIDQEGGTDTPPDDREEPDNEDSEGEGELVSLGDGRGSRVNDPRDPNQIAGTLDDRLSDERGEGPIGGLKLEGDYKVAEVGPSIASSDPEEGGEVFNEVKFKIEPAYLKFGEYKVEPEPDGDLKVEGGIKFEGARFDDTQNVAGFAPSAGPPGAPIPYPAVEGDGDDLAESLARKAGGGQQDFFKVKMEEVMVTSVRPGGEPLDEQAGEAPVTREAFDGIKGESQDKDHKVGVEFGRRTEVKDSHDRFSNVGSEEPKTVAELADNDDDFESSSLLDLKPEPDVKEMLPGLAGELPDDAELEFDLDDDLDDTDESEL